MGRCVAVRPQLQLCCQCWQQQHAAAAGLLDGRLCHGVEGGTRPGGCSRPQVLEEAGGEDCSTQAKRAASNTGQHHNVLRRVVRIVRVSETVVQ
jgi:hypothetical protein